jgi:TonB family protein
MHRLLLPMLPLLLLLGGSLHAQGPDTLFLDREQRECARDTAYYYRIYEPLDDTLYAVADYFRWGVLHMEGRMIGYRQGALKEGPFRYYYETGAPQAAVSYVRNEEEGEYRSWYPDGKLQSKGQYGLGRRVGIFTTWYSDGNLESEGGYRNNERHGPWTYWHPNGAVKGKGVFDRNVESGHWEWRYEDGELEGMGEFDPITAKGERTWYDRSGRVCANEMLLESTIVEGTYIAEDGSEHHDTKLAYSKPRPADLDDSEEMTKYFAKLVEYPEEAGGRTGYVILSAIIDRTGAISDMRIEMSTNDLFDAAARAAVRAVEWRPGIRHGIAAMDYVVVPLVFKP